MTEMQLVHGPWQFTRPEPTCPALAGYLRADIVVIGGGISGLSCAYHLACAGLDVVLLEGEAIGAQSSARNYGIIDTSWPLAARAPARLAQARFLRGCTERLKDVIAAEGIACDFREGTKFWRLARTEAQAQECRERAADLAALGYSAGYAPGPMVPVTTEQVPGAFWVEEAQLNPYRLLTGLRDAFLRRGGRLFESSPVLEVRDGDRFVARTPGGSITADSGVIATGGLTNAFRPSAGFSLPVQIYSLATRPLPDDIAATIGPRGGESVLDMGETGRFTQRFMRDGRLWFGAGIVSVPRPEDVARPRLNTTVAEGILAELFHRYPALTPTDIDFWWGGTLSRTVGERPLIGKIPGSRSTYIALVCMGKGMGLGSSAGVVMRQLIAPGSTPVDPDLLAFLPYCDPGASTGTDLQRTLHRIAQGPILRRIANFFLNTGSQAGGHALETPEADTPSRQRDG